MNRANESRGRTAGPLRQQSRIELCPHKSQHHVQFRIGMSVSSRPELSTTLFPLRPSSSSRSIDRFDKMLKPEEAKRTGGRSSTAQLCFRLHNRRRFCDSSPHNRHRKLTKMGKLGKACPLPKAIAYRIYLPILSSCRTALASSVASLKMGIDTHLPVRTMGKQA